VFNWNASKEQSHRKRIAEPVRVAVRNSGQNKLSCRTLAAVFGVGFPVQKNYAVFSGIAFSALAAGRCSCLCRVQEKFVALNAISTERSGISYA